MTVVLSCAQVLCVGFASLVLPILVHDMQSRCHVQVLLLIACVSNVQATAMPQDQEASEAAKQDAVAPMMDASTAERQEEHADEGAEDALDSALDMDDVDGEEDVDLGFDEVGMHVATLLCIAGLGKAMTPAVEGVPCFLLSDLHVCGTLCNCVLQQTTVCSCEPMSVQGDEEGDVLYDDFDDEAAMRQLEALG